HHGEHDADEVFTSWGEETVRKYTREEIEKILAELDSSDEYGTILRAKGMVETPDGTWIDFDMVPGQTEIREGGAETTGKLCVIGGINIKEDKLEELFGLR
ncbi:MAG: GTP-binding protein, partial [Lachnospiraceae bacterium]|nr:GTP-binding protein [Lachnospiraceae bacterium]